MQPHTSTFDGTVTLGGVCDTPQPPRGDQVSPPSGVYHTPPLAVAAYARSPLSLTRRSRTRPATRGRPPACPPSTTLGPIGTQRSASPPVGASRAAPRTCGC